MYLVKVSVIQDGLGALITPDLVHAFEACVSMRRHVQTACTHYKLPFPFRLSHRSESSFADIHHKPWMSSTSQAHSLQLAERRSRRRIGLSGHNLAADPWRLEQVAERDWERGVGD